MPQSRRLLFLFIALTAFVPHARASKCGSDAQSTIATDRPQVTESSIVVPCGSLQFENGFLETEDGHQWSLDLPETVPDYFTNDDTAAGFTSGTADVSLGYTNSSSGR
jgi:hypothetical protein